MSVRTALTLWLATALLDTGGARLLDSLGLIEGLLSPTGARLSVLVPLALLFYAARFVAWFLAPGLLFGALATSTVVSLRRVARQRNARSSSLS